VIRASLALLLAAALLAQAAGAQVPRHPPVLVDSPIEPVAVALADAYDLAFIASVAASQTQEVVSLTGAIQGPLGALAGTLRDARDALYAGDLERAADYLGLVEENLRQLTAADLQSLAMDNPAYIPACARAVEGGVVYVISGPQEELTRGSPAYCPAPTDSIESRSALDTILALLSAGNLTQGGVYTLVFVHVPPAAAYPDVVNAILDAGLAAGLESTLNPGGANDTALPLEAQQLLEIVRTGEREEALDALQRLLELARAGEVPYNVYAEALAIFAERFGEAPVNQDREAVELNLTELASQMDDLVKAAERARAEARPDAGGVGFSLPSPSVAAPDPALLVAGVIGLAAVATVAVLRERRPALVIPRLVVGRPPRGAGPEWCYRALVAVLSLRGLPKEPWETPREYLERVLHRLEPGVAEVAELVTEAFEASVYGGESVSVDVESCVRSLRRLMLPWRRLSAG